MDKPKKKRRRGLKITILAVLAVVAIGGGMLLAYFDVFNIKEKMIAGMTEEEFWNQEGNTSFDLIDKALEEGKIDKETSLVYGAYAAFGDERLPEEYRSEVIAYEANDIFYEIRNSYDSFSAENKKNIDPFLKRPDDPESYWSQKIAKQTNNNPDLVKTAQAKDRPSGWGYFDTSDGKFRVWYSTSAGIPILDPIYSLHITREQAETVQMIINKANIYHRFKDLLKRDTISDGDLGGNDRIDIYLMTPYDILLRPRNGGCSGVTIPNNSGKTSAHIILYTTSQSTVAHEIFHVFQFAYNYDYKYNKVWAEATAAWAEDYIFKSHNSEQYRLKFFLPYPELSYEQSAPHHKKSGRYFEYGAYIFPYFITQNFGNDKIRQIWEDCEKTSCLKAVDANVDGGLKKQWPEFTLWNYNKEPVKYYKDQNGFPDISSAQYELSRNYHTLAGGGKKEIKTPGIEPLSARLAEINNKLDESRYKKVKFDAISDLGRWADENLSIKAIIYPKNGEPYVDKHNWLKSDRTFCLENPKENFERIVLIYSYSKREGKMGTGQIYAYPQEESCYAIDQEDERTAKIELDEMAVGLATTPTVDSAIKVKTEGKLVESAKQEVRYGYQSKWEAKLDYEEQWSSFNFKATPVDTCTVNPGKTTHTANFKFDLSSVKDGDAVTIEASDLNVHYDPWQSICTIAGIT
ncbi:MAG: hypothetical protein ABII72_04995, partial [Parcubacteria group bacterium]